MIVDETATPFDAFILVGGRSSRLGTAKAFVELDGKSLLRVAVDVVGAALPKSRATAVAGNSAQFPIQAITAGVPFIFDLHEGRGPLGGIHAALGHARSPWIFVLACDYPFVSSDLIRLLADNISDEFHAVVPGQADGRLQPLCAFYKVAVALPIVEELLERPRVSPPMHEVAVRLNPLIIKFESYSHLPGAEELFCNINTGDDADRARKIIRGFRRGN